MTAFTIDEIIPGAVVRVDTTRLRTLGTSETNAQVTPTEDRAVTGTHDFLVVEVAGERVVAVPLFPRSSPGSAPLEPEKRRGEAGGWREEPVHYSRWQHWRIPLAALVAASADDPGSPSDRRGYAVGDVDTLRGLLNWASRNRCAFRTV